MVKCRKLGNKNLKHFREAFSSINPEVERTLKRIVFSVEFSRAGSAFSFSFLFFLFFRQQTTSSSGQIQSQEGYISQCLPKKQSIFILIVAQRNWMFHAFNIIICIAFVFPHFCNRKLLKVLLLGLK